MLLVKMADASKPHVLPKDTHIVAGYIGGDTPHVWTDKEWERFHGIKKLPIFVRSNVVGSVGGKQDGFTALEALYALKVPQGSAVVYDRETNTDRDATIAFGQILSWAHYYVFPYGSKGNLFDHPSLNGYWVADPTGHPHMYDHPRVVATQFQFDATNGFDFSEVDYWAASMRIKAVWG